MPWYIAWIFTRLGAEIIGILLLVAAVGYLKHDYDTGIANEAIAKVRKDEVAPLKAQLDEAHKRATDLALLWSAQVTKTEAAQAAQKKAEDAKNQAFAAKTAALSHAPTVFLTADAFGLWRELSADANGQAAPGAGVPQAGAAGISESAFTEWVDQARTAYKGAVSLYHQARDDLRSCLKLSAGAS